MWDKAQFEAFLQDNPPTQDQQRTCLLYTSHIKDCDPPAFLALGFYMTPRVLVDNNGIMLTIGTFQVSGLLLGNGNSCPADFFDQLRRCLLYTSTVTTGTTERNWVTLFKQYENVEELNRRVLMSLVDRILIHENHAIEIVFKYRDEYQQTIEYVLGYADELDIDV